jgi:hypothetical protein
MSEKSRQICIKQIWRFLCTKSLCAVLVSCAYESRFFCLINNDALQKDASRDQLLHE